MENADKIRKRIKKIYIELFLLSIVLAGSLCVVEKWVLTSSTIPHESMGCFILSIFLIEIVIISVINAFMIIWVLKEPDSWDRSSLIVFGTIFNIFLYIITVICLIVKRIRPNNGWLVLLGILLSFVIAVILELIAWCFYIHVGTMSRLYYYSCFLDPFQKNFDEKIQTYNCYANRYNEMNLEISNIAKQLKRKEYKYIKLDEYELVAAPQYDASDIHLFFCAYGYDYLSMVHDYISYVNKEIEKVEKLVLNMDMILNQKEEYLGQLKINLDRISNPLFTEEQKQLFSDISNMLYDNKKLVKKSRLERKIKPLRRSLK